MTEGDPPPPDRWSPSNGEDDPLDYGSGVRQDDHEDDSLPPAWDVSAESFVVGYEPVGQTSIGNADERRSHTRFSRFRTPADRLAKHNEGRHPSDGALGARLARLDKKRITQAYCSLLGLSRFQRDEAVRAMLLLDLDAFGHQKAIRKVALSTIYVVVNYNRLQQLRRPKADRISETVRFKELVSEVGLDIGALVRLSRNVKDELKTVEFFEASGAERASTRGSDRRR